MDNHTVSFNVNGEDLGVAFESIPSENVWIALNLYSRDQEIEIL